MDAHIPFSVAKSWGGPFPTTVWILAGLASLVTYILYYLKASPRVPSPRQNREASHR